MWDPVYLVKSVFSVGIRFLSNLFFLGEIRFFLSYMGFCGIRFISQICFFLWDPFFLSNLVFCWDPVFWWVRVLFFWWGRPVFFCRFVLLSDPGFLWDPVFIIYKRVESGSVLTTESGSNFKIRTYSKNFSIHTMLH